MKMYTKILIKNCFFKKNFINRYSPSDWIEEKELDEWGQKKGHLSTRMLISDNTWVQMWESAKPVPANRQKRLFDDTREAEKVLHYLESQFLWEICQTILPVLSHVAIHMLMKEIRDISRVLPNLNLSVNDIARSIQKISRDPRVHPDKYEIVFQEIFVQELLICQLKSIMFKFNPAKTEEPIDNFIINLVTEREVYVDDTNKSYIGSKVVSMFSDVQKAVNLTVDPIGAQMQQSNKSLTIFPQPSKREFVMRVKTEKTDVQMNTIHHMLRAILTKNDFRLYGAFSENIIS